MHRLTHELMFDQVRAIYHALTGTDLPRIETHMPVSSESGAAAMISSRFAELEALSRLVPMVAARVPPFAFCPPIDVVDRKKELHIEVALPGVARENVEIKGAGDMLLIFGVREWETGNNGQAHRYGEIPRGPFKRVIMLPPDVTAEPLRVELSDGLLRIHLGKVHLGAAAKA